MTVTNHEQIARRVLDPWNSHDVDRVVACYTPDLVYLDPGTRGPVRGAEAFRRYLTRMFGSWRMHWAAREVFPLAGTDGSAVLWRATLTPAGGGPPSRSRAWTWRSSRASSSSGTRSTSTAPGWRRCSADPSGRPCFGGRLR